MELKDVLKNLLKEEGLSISQLVKRTKIPVQTLHNWLNGMEPRSLKQLRKVADYFKVSLDYLCFGVQKDKNSSQFDEYKNKINAGIFEVVLRRIKK